MAEPIQLGEASSLALDADRGQVFWTGSLPSQSERGIHRLDLATGSDVVLIDRPVGLGLELDAVSKHLYWPDGDGIWRSDLDGNDIQLIISDAGNVASMVVAPVPEPSTLTLALVAFLLACGRRDRGRTRSGCTTR